MKGVLLLAILLGCEVCRGGVHGASCIAVSTGSYSKEALMEAGADIVLESLENRDACLSFMNSVS